MDTVEQIFGGRFSLGCNHPIRSFRRRLALSHSGRTAARLLQMPWSIMSISALGTVALLGLLLLVRGNQAPATDQVLPDQVLRSLSISQNQRSARESLLARINLEQDRKIASQIHFVSEIILSHRSKSAILTKAQVRTLSATIVSESLRAGFDPLFVASIIKSESTFNTMAKSPAGAIGLMQMLPSTGSFVANAAGYHATGSQNLHDPEYNIKLGILYLAYLRKEFKGNNQHMLIAYNWGPENFRQTLRSGRQAPSSTIGYANKILGHYQKWEEAFEGQSARYRHFDFDRAAIEPISNKNVG